MVKIKKYYTYQFMKNLEITKPDNASSKLDKKCVSSIESKRLSEWINERMNEQLNELCVPTEGSVEPAYFSFSGLFRWQYKIIIVQKTRK